MYVKIYVHLLLLERNLLMIIPEEESKKKNYICSSLVNGSTLQGNVLLDSCCFGAMIAEDIGLITLDLTRRIN